jgi:FtsP/CotA-like multicopper oxidase with cupredoxin domain
MKRIAIAFLIGLMVQAIVAQTKTGAAAAAPANSVPCAATGQDLVPLSEADAVNHILHATIMTTAEQVRMTNSTFGGAPTTCYPQWIREYKLVTGSTTEIPASTTLPDPSAGPLLRAEVGDLIEVSFLNMIDPNKFPNSDTGCDKTSTYPGSGAGNDPDVYPDCFALSTTTNMHYHGTHTNPSSTGDNVFLEIKPSPRSNSSARVPVVTPDTVKGPFNDFFNKCQEHLNLNNAPQQWPHFWVDLPKTLRDYEEGLLQKYAPDLLAKNEEQIKQGAWPEYYMGNYPYCFRLPKYTSVAYPPAPAAVTTSPHSHGAGSAEHDDAVLPARPLLMGQAPGTHWYHAHKHGSTTINVRNGMTGIFVIEDNSATGYDGYIKAQYKQYGGIKQQVLLINQLATAPSLERGGGGGPGPRFSVNGRLIPKITMTGGEVQLWRLANNSSRAGINFLTQSATGLSWRQTSQDGVQFQDSNYQTALNQPILLAAGNRADILIKAPTLPAGTNTATYNVVVENTVDPTDRPPYTNAATETLVTVQVNANGQNMPFMATMPPMPPYLNDVTDAEVKGHDTTTLDFASSAPAPNGGPIANNPAQHTINGKKFDGEVGAIALLNTADEWKITNATYVPNQISHPFHIHINPFQVSELFDPNAVISSAAGAGTVTTTKGASTVTGTGTTFTKSTQVGNFIWINGEATATILSIQSDTALTVNIAAAGVTNATYTLAVPTYSINKPTQQGQCYLNPSDSTSWHPCTATAPALHRVWWDVFSIPSGNIFYSATNPATTYNIPGYFKLRSRFVDYAGYYVLHCHILAHEDRGMMTVVEVTPLQPPYSHH